ncbi:MAG: hypothetical protein RR612_08870 [Oscillospiraceae bacterium]
MSLGKNVSKVNMNVYRKVSNITPPFWGVTASRIDQLETEEEDFYVEFVYNKGSITLTSGQIKTLLSTKKVNKDGDFKIVLKDLAPWVPNVPKSQAEDSSGIK